MIFDTHAHYDDDRFDGDRDRLFNEYFPCSGVCGVITCGTDEQSCQKAVDLAEKYPNVYAAVGIYPENTENGVNLEKLRSLSNHEKVKAIGEIGLEYHYEGVPHDIQKREFERQILLANELCLPVIVHNREAHNDTLEILKRTKPRGVIHCFSGSVEVAKEILKLDMYIGLGGAVTFKNARVPVEAARYVPLDRLVLETDAPYMSPVPHRGERCDSVMIKYVAERIAKIKQVSVEKILEITEKNARKLFNIR